MTRQPEAERFWAKVDKTGEHWLWTGSISANTGYGKFMAEGRRFIGAHRWAYENVVGPIPVGLQIDHLCRVKTCVRPAHLEAVTPKVNVLRARTAAGLANQCRRGHSLADAYRHPSTGGRQCRTCRREWAREYMRQYWAVRRVPRAV